MTCKEMKKPTSGTANYFPLALRGKNSIYVTEDVQPDSAVAAPACLSANEPISVVNGCNSTTVFGILFHTMSLLSLIFEFSFIFCF
jgi:hypothetical protein